MTLIVCLSEQLLTLSLCRWALHCWGARGNALTGIRSRKGLHSLQRLCFSNGCRRNLILCQRILSHSASQLNRENCFYTQVYMHSDLFRMVIFFFLTGFTWVYNEQLKKKLCRGLTVCSTWTYTLWQCTEHISIIPVSNIKSKFSNRLITVELLQSVKMHSSNVLWLTVVIPELGCYGCKHSNLTKWRYQSCITLNAHWELAQQRLLIHC